MKEYFVVNKDTRKKKSNEVKVKILQFQKY